MIVHQRNVISIDIFAKSYCVIRMRLFIAVYDVNKNKHSLNNNGQADCCNTVLFCVNFLDKSTEQKF